MNPVDDRNCSFLSEWSGDNADNYMRCLGNGIQGIWYSIRLHLWPSSVHLIHSWPGPDHCYFLSTCSSTHHCRRNVAYCYRCTSLNVSKSAQIESQQKHISYWTLYRHRLETHVKCTVRDMSHICFCVLNIWFIMTGVKSCMSSNQLRLNPAKIYFITMVG